MGPKPLSPRSTVPEDALVEDRADDAAVALVPAVVCLLELPLPQSPFRTGICARRDRVAPASARQRRSRRSIARLVRLTASP
jgi:hypothetical protein